MILWTSDWISTLKSTGVWVVHHYNIFLSFRRFLLHQLAPRIKFRCPGTIMKSGPLTTGDINSLYATKYFDKGQSRPTPDTIGIAPGILRQYFRQTRSRSSIILPSKCGPEMGRSGNRSASPSKSCHK